MRRALTRKFFDRPALVVAQELLGKFLCRRLGGGTAKCLMITEVEAYDGFKDKASHAHRGKTLRNAPMFGEAGRWYIYFTYGMHWMLNIVTGPKDYPAAVLIRGVRRDPISSTVTRSDLVISGPGRITKFLKIDKHFNNRPATKAGLWIEDRGISARGAAPAGGQGSAFGGKIKKTPRIGVDYAEEWAKKKYRFIMIK